MMRRLVLMVCLVIGGGVILPQTAHADTLQVRPLLYKETLSKGEAKRGAIDIANGSQDKEEYALSVRLFRQVGDDGSLEFYDRPDVTDGILLDVTSIELNPKDAARITFTVDGSKLPQGDVFAVILVTTKHTTAPDSIVPAAQVGTLLVLQNGQPGPRTAQIDTLSIPQIQTGDKVTGTVTVKNPASMKQTTGFFPQMKVSIEPWGATTQFEGPLVYAGRARTFDFSVPSSQFGVYKMTVSANGSTESRYVFLMTGKWQVIAPLLGVALLGLIIVTVLGVRLYRKKHHGRR